MRIAGFADIRALMAGLPGPDAGAAQAARARDAELTKPAGALGRLEEIAVWLAAWQGRHPARVEKPVVLVFAGNHGVAARGVSAYPASVTAQMVANFEAGGAAVNQLAELAGARLEVAALALERPTGDVCAGPAMSEAECADAFRAGFEAVGDADLVCVGEMGIGNTTVAACLAAALFGGDGAGWAGPGTGLDGAGVARKAALVDAALARHQAARADPLTALAALGGREFAAMAGAVLAGRLRRVPVVLDGYACCAAAGVLLRLADGALDHCLAAHVGAEPAHRRLLACLGLEPVLDLGLRLGEASGAALACLIVRAAALAHARMATFAEAGVAGRRAGAPPPGRS